MRVTMIGAGYVGLVSGACFADFGHQVTVIDRDAGRVAALNRGEIPIFEPGLADLVEANFRQGRLEFAAETARAADAEAVFIAVGTPSRRGDGHADLSFVYDVVRDIAPVLCGAAVVVTKSTVPVGTGDEIERILRERRPDATIEVVSNPEFLREGAAIQDFKHPDRIVVGTEDARARTVLAEVYRPLYLNAAPILYVGRRTAELIKYASNAFLATKITFINEMADLCEQVGADVQDAGPCRSGRAELRTRSRSTCQINGASDPSPNTRRSITSPPPGPRRGNGSAPVAFLRRGRRCAGRRSPAASLRS